jgi:Universal stress protein family
MYPRTPPPIRRAAAYGRWRAALMIPDRIVVGVDGSEPSKDALRWARFMADATGSAIDAVAVWHVAPVWEGAGWTAIAS